MIQLEFQDQQPQANGYWLQTWQRTDDHPQQLPIQFALHLKNADQPAFNAALMQQETNCRTGDSGKKLQFLSPQKLMQPQILTLPLDLHCLWQAQTTGFFHCFLEREALQTQLQQWLVPMNGRTLLITAKGQQIATALHLIQQLRQLPLEQQPAIAVLLEADAQGQFPFQPKPALMLFEELAQIAPEAIGTMPLLEDWQIVNRLCNPTFQPGCYDGTIEALMAAWQQQGLEHWQQRWVWLNMDKKNDSFHRQNTTPAKLSNRSTTHRQSGRSSSSTR